MKKYFLLVCMLLCRQILFAQVSPILSQIPSKHKQVISTLLQFQDTKRVMTARTTAGVTMEHVIAQSTHDSLGTILDSVNLTYSPNHGSIYDYNTMIYPYNYPYNTSPMFNFNGVFTKPQVLADTYMHWTLNPYTLAYGLYESTYSGYDISSNLTIYDDVFVDSVTNTNTSYVNSFNTANNIAAGTWFISNSGVADSTFRQFFTYNTANKLIKDSIYEYHLGGWHLVGKTFYTYDTANNLIQIDDYAQTDTTFDSVLVEQLQYINTYDLSHRLLTVATNQFNNVSLIPSAIDSFTYTGAYTFNTSWKEYQYDNINHYWAPQFYMTKSLNTAGFPYTVNILAFDSILNSWVFNTFDRISYDSYNNPDTLFEYDYGYTGFPITPSYTTVYYYSPYINVTVVNNSSNVLRPVIYPNPASNIVTISNLEPGNIATITLVNAAGQTVRRENSYIQNKISRVSVSDLAPGDYWIMIQDASGNVIHKQALIKE